MFLVIAITLANKLFKISVWDLDLIWVNQAKVLRFAVHFAIITKSAQKPDFLNLQPQIKVAQTI